MKKKGAVRIVKGTSLLTDTNTEQSKPYQNKIDKCLNCTKPAKECKGDCK